MKSFIKAIRFLFLSLFFLTPLIFTQSNSELFELPKMYLVYLITLLITTFHLINVLKFKAPLYKKTFLDIPLILFLISQTISTVYSVDPHTSFFGYYSRLNGGLLSLVCYSLLYWILCVYIDSDLKKKIINFSLLSAFLVSIYAIAQHFGIDKNWWVQDVQSRVFSTFGQPNWLAAYLCIVLPFGIHKFLEIIPKKDLILNTKYLILNTSFFISILFTKSKSGIIASLISIGLFFLIYLIKNIKNKSSLIKITIFVFIFTSLSLIINNPIKDNIFPKKSQTPITTTLETNKLNITSSENIRKIVWVGAIDLWKKFPIFGTGTETFAYSYYWTRPVEHNLTSEWDFLYNKAHNEYINYLATTGVVGLVTYVFLILSILFFLIKSSSSTTYNLQSTLICSFISILITNFAGFSVVITSLFFFLIPALLIQDSEISPSKNIQNKFNLLLIPLIIISFLLIKNNILFYFADITYSKSETYDSQNNYQQALVFAQISHQFNPKEPLYIDKLATIYSKIALSTKKQEDIDKTIEYSNLAISISPANIGFWKQRAQAYLYLSGIDTKYFPEAIDSLSKANQLAPTDAKIPYITGQFLETANLKDKAIPYYQQAIKLKPNYDHAYFALGKIYLTQKNNQLAKENLQKTIDYSYPTNTQAQELLKTIK